MRGTSKRGYATVLAMLMLVLGTTLSAWLYTMVQHGTAMSRNEQSAAKTRMVSESGLSYMQFKLREAAEATPIKVSDPEEMLLLLGDALVDQMPAGRVEVREDEFGIPSVHVLSTEVKGGTFVASLGLSKTYDPGFRLSVTGTAGKLSSTIGVEYLVGDANAGAWMNYPILSKGEMKNTDGAKIYHWNTQANQHDGVWGEVYDLDNGAVMSFDDKAPTELEFPPKYLPDQVYAKLDELKGTVVLPAYASSEPGNGGGKGGGGKGGGGKPAGGTAVTELTDCYIPPGTNLVLGSGATITGVVYVGYPNNITISSSATINGVIIYEKPTDGEAGSVITFDKTMSVYSDPAVTMAAVSTLMIKSGETTESAEQFAAAVYPWTIHAPDTDLDLVEGNTGGTVNYWGSFHVNDFVKAAGAGGGGTQQDGANKYVFHGTVVCEGDVTILGNRSFSVSPESEARPNVKPEYLALDVRPGGYWEE